MLNRRSKKRTTIKQGKRNTRTSKHMIRKKKQSMRKKRARRRIKRGGSVTPVSSPFVPRTQTLQDKAEELIQLIRAHIPIDNVGSNIVNYKHRLNIILESKDFLGSSSTSMQTPSSGPFMMPATPTITVVDMDDITRIIRNIGEKLNSYIQNTRIEDSKKEEMIHNIKVLLGIQTGSTLPQQRLDFS